MRNNTDSSDVETKEKEGECMLCFILRRQTLLMTTQELLPRFKTAEKVMRSTGETGLPTVRQNDLASASPVRGLFKTKLKGKDGDLISKHCLADGVCVYFKGCC